MNQVEVEIIGMAITARYGTLQTGTILRTDEAYAKHLVEDCGAAKYRTIAQGTLPEGTTQPETPPDLEVVETPPDLEVVETPAEPRKKVGKA